MRIATRQGDLSATTSMAEEGVGPSEYDHVGAFFSQNPQEGIKENIKKSAFEITHVVQVDNENEDLETSQLHNRTVSEDDNPASPLSADVLAASTPSKNVSSNKDIAQSVSALPIMNSAGATVTNVNGPSHLHGSRFRKVNDYVRERWKVSDSLEVDADEHSDISEPRHVAQKMLDGTSNSSSPSTPRRNASLEMASTSTLSDVRSDVHLDEATRNEGATLTEAPSITTSRRTSTELSQDDIVSNDDNCESHSQGTPSETNIKTDTESSSVEIQNVVRNAEIIKTEALKIHSFVESIISENNKLKQTVEKLRKENYELKMEIQQLRNSEAQQMPTSAVPS